MRRQLPDLTQKLGCLDGSPWIRVARRPAREVGQIGCHIEQPSNGDRLGVLVRPMIEACEERSDLALEGERLGSQDSKRPAIDEVENGRGGELLGHRADMVDRELVGRLAEGRLAIALRHDELAVKPQGEAQGGWRVLSLAL